MKNLSRLDYLLLVLGLLSNGGKEIVSSRTKLMKIMYLLQKENNMLVEELTGSKEPYVFDWYLFGPFSVDVLNDLDKLSQEGLVDIVLEEKETYIQYNYMLTRAGRERFQKILKEVDKRIIYSLENYLSKYKQMSASQIKRLVYRKYLSEIELSS